VRRWAVAGAAAAATAVLLWLASPAVGVGWLAWVALVPVAAAAVAFEGTRAGRAAVPLAYGLYLESQLVPALPFGIAEGQWGDPPLPIMVGDSPVVFAALVVVPLFALLLYALRFPQPLARPGPAALVLAPPAVWTALDLVRAKLDPSGLWGPLFLTQHDLPSARLAALAGPWLLTFLLVASGWALAALLVRGRQAVPVAATIAVLGAALAVATAGIRGVHAVAPVAVGVVQPGYDTAEHGEYEPPRFFGPPVRDLERATLDLVADLGELTRDAVAEGGRVVVWPEAVAWVHPVENERVREAIAELARETGAALVVPLFLDPRSGAVAFTPEGEPTPLRPKRRPMWFLGERALDVGPGVKDLGPARVGTLLGVDNQDPAAARALARLAAGLLVSATHDWRELAPQQRAYSALHAAALRTPLARADWRFGSAVWDSDGKLLASAALDRARGTLVVSVHPAHDLTPYGRIGDVLGWAAALAALLLLAAGIRLRRRW
jgi:apolipoprotein N-acyltransferase